MSDFTKITFDWAFLGAMIHFKSSHFEIFLAHLLGFKGQIFG